MLGFLYIIYWKILLSHNYCSKKKSFCASQYEMLVNIQQNYLKKKVFFTENIIPNIVVAFWQKRVV